MTIFLALYRGAMVGAAMFIRVLIDANREAYIASRLMRIGFDGPQNNENAVLDSVWRTNTLKLIATNAHNHSVYNRTESGGE